MLGNNLIRNSISGFGYYHNCFYTFFHVFRDKNQIGLTVKLLISAPAIEQESLKKPMIKKFIEKICAGNPRLLLNHLMENEKLSDDDIQYL